MKIDCTYELTNSSSSFLINEFKKGHQNYLTIDDENIKDSLLRNKLVEVDIDNEILCFRLTEQGIKYCEQQIESNKNAKKEDFIKWASLGLSVIAIILSIVSLSIQVMSYHNKKIDIKSDKPDIMEETIDNSTTIGSGIE